MVVARIPFISPMNVIMKNLNIGMIGYGFMGRTHSNAYSQVNHFFSIEIQAGAEGGLCPRCGKGAVIR